MRHAARSTSRGRPARTGDAATRPKNGQDVGHVPAPDPLLLAPVSARFLSQDERLEIADLRRAGHTVRSIAAAVDRSPSTVSRELRRNARADDRYRPFEATALPCTAS